MLHSEENDERSDARNDDSSNTADQIKEKLIPKRVTLINKVSSA